MTSKRLGEYIAFKNISYYAFENSINASRGSISKAVSNGKSIGSNVLENILSKYEDLNPIWLLTGKGKMLVTGNVALEKYSTEEIIDHVFKNLMVFNKDQKFQLIARSLHNDNELQHLKLEIESIKQQLKSR